MHRDTRRASSNNALNRQFRVTESSEPLVARRRGSVDDAPQTEAPLTRSLCEYASEGDAASLKRALATNYPDERDGSGCPALALAVANGHSGAVDVLLAAGASVDLPKVPEGATPLFVACALGHFECVQTLVASGANVNAAKATTGASPLYVACQKGRVDIVGRLLQANADANQARDTGATPLYIACAQNQPLVVDRLLQAGARPALATHDLGATPLLIACEENHVDCVRRLLRAHEMGTAHVDLNQRSKAGATPLFVACQHGRPEVVRRLLLAGADAARAFEGVTPLEKARAKGHAACAELLEDPPRHPNAPAEPAARAGQRSAADEEVIRRRKGERG